MTTRITAVPADPWDLIPAAVRAFVALNGIYPTRVRIDRGTEAALEHGTPSRVNPVREWRLVYGLTPEWDAERLEVL